MARLKGDANGCETAIKEAYAIGRQIFGDQLEGQDVFMDLNIELGLLALMRGANGSLISFLFYSCLVDTDKWIPRPFKTSRSLS
jgi:hypothetical protein